MIDLIFKRKLAPGERLPNEVELSKQFGVSMTVVKQAVSGLIALGLVIRKQGRNGGLFIGKPELGPLKTFMRGYLTGQKFTRSHFQELRNAIEPLTARLAAERITDDRLQQLNENIKQFKKYADRMSRRPSRQLYTRMQTNICDFHRIVAGATGNPLIILVIDYLMDVLASMGMELYSDYSVAVGRRIADEHHTIYDVLCRRDAHAAESHMYEHINWANKELGRLER